MRFVTICTATNKKLVTFLFWTATKTNYTSKCSDFQKKLIDNITTSNLYLQFKENNENDMAAQVFWAVFYSSQLPSQIDPTAAFDSAAIPPLIFSMSQMILMKILAPLWKILKPCRVYDKSFIHLCKVQITQGSSWYHHCVVLNSRISEFARPWTVSKRNN